MKHAALVIIAGVSLTVGIGIGYGFSPEFRADMQDKSGPMQPLGAADRYLDKRYLENVIAHHLTAIDVAEQALSQSSRSEIKDLAKVIIEVDTAAIEKLNQYRLDWYGDSRPITRFERINLGNADDRFDLRLLNTLIAHHQDAIMMSREVMTKSRREEVLDSASTAIVELSAGVTTLTNWRDGWYQ